MRCRKAGKATAANAARDLPELDRLGGTINSTAYRCYRKTQVAIRAELIGSDRCIATGIDVQAASPVLTMCRRLLEAGFDPALSLECYRNDVLALTVASIGHGAGLEINGHGTGFRPISEGGAASLVPKSNEVEVSGIPEPLAHLAGGIR